MRPGPLLALLLGLVCGTDALAAFESFSGSAPGVGLDSAWYRPRSLPGVREGLSLCVEGGRPAPVQELLWSSARIGYARWGFAADAEAYVQSLEDAYRESIVGVSLEWAGLAAGIRFWRVAWAGFPDRSGTVVSLVGRRDLGRLVLGATMQDLSLGARDSAAPSPQYGVAGAVRLGSIAAIQTGWNHQEDQRGLMALVTLDPAPELGLFHGFRYPGPRWRSGLELRRSAWNLRLWVEPDAVKGASVGWSFSYR